MRIHIFRFRNGQDYAFGAGQNKAHIYNTFDETNMIAVLVPVGDYTKEKALISEVNGLPGIRSALGLASIEIEEGVC